MTNELRTYLTEQVNALKNAASCCAEAKAVCAEWLEAAGTDKEAEMTKKLIAEVEADIMPVDGLIAFELLLQAVKQALKFLAKKWLKTYLPMPKKLKRTAQNSAIARPALPVLPLSPKKLNCNLTA